MSAKAPDSLDGRKAWTVAFLLFLSQIINYFDKSVMGLAAPSIMRDLGLTPAQYGLVASSFYALYAISGLCVGMFVAQRIRSKPLLTILVLIWSVAQLPIIFFSSLSMLILSRLLLGIGEGPASPTATSAAHEWFSDNNRNMPTALLMIGASLGSVLAGPILSHVMILYGWRAGFVLCCALGLAWAALWTLFGASGPQGVVTETHETSPATDMPHIPQSYVWTDPMIIGCIIVGFCSYWAVAFSVAWLAPFARLGLGYDAVTTGWIVSGVAGVNALFMGGLSFLSERLLKRGISSRIARAGVNSACMALGGAILLGAALVTAPQAKLALLAVGGSLPLLTFALGPAMVSEVVPAEHRSRMLITIYAGITVAGFISPIVAGQLIGDRALAGYDLALMANALVMAVGGVAGFALLRPAAARARIAARSGAA